MIKHTGTLGEKDYKFSTSDFYEMLEKQDKTCPLTGRELTPENTTAEHKKPLRLKGKHIKDNIYLIDKDVAKIKRYLTEEQVVQLAFEILMTRGKEFGYKVQKVSK